MISESAKSESTKDTAEFCLQDAQRKIQTPRVPSALVDVRVGGLSHQGKVRDNNEDHFVIARFSRALRTLLTNMPGDPIGGGHEEVGYGMLVADGMGGMAAGEIASRSAIESLVELVVKTPDWIMSRDDQLTEVVMHRMAQRLRNINDQLLHQAENDPTLAGMGTTLTLACSLGLDLVFCHIGDSRAYLFRHDEFRQLTRDMTVAQEMVDAGTLSPAAAATNRLRHYLTQFLGTPGSLRAQVQHLPLESGDRVLLCSDGLTEMAGDAAIADVLRKVREPQAACQALVDLALEGGGKDNVTALVAEYQLRTH
ncbi:MAG: serine/threonine-protein phosphatase [Planctomycetes bacterium]|nr:serine/threonine-protein phosphatase [Planctomycetota bacterium]